MTEHNLDNISELNAVIQKSPKKNRFFSTFFVKLDRK